MAETPLRLGFAGTPEFAVPALKRLAATAGVDLSAVFTQPDRPAGRGQDLRSSPVKQAAAELGVPVLQPVSLRAAEALEALAALRLDVMVVAAYGLILPTEALAAPRFGCINVHASLLPRWRGAAPIQRALLAGDARTGITIMRMDEGLDTGPMLAWRDIEILGEDTAASLHDRLAALGAELLVDSLPGIVEGSLRAVPQPEVGVTYAPKLSKREARIDWQQSAQEISRRVRAFNPWPVAETTLQGKQLRLWEATAGPEAMRRDEVPGAEPGLVLAADEGGIDVVTGQGLLRITRLQLTGRKALSAGDFIKAHPLAGVRLT